MISCGLGRWAVAIVTDGWRMGYVQSLVDGGNLMLRSVATTADEYTDHTKPLSTSETSAFCQPAAAPISSLFVAAAPPRPTGVAH